MREHVRREEGGVRAREHRRGHVSIVAFLSCGTWSWADTVGFTAVVGEHWLSCDTSPD